MKPIVIMPTYNERENLPSLIPEVLATDPRLHVLVVDDGSPDGSSALVRELITARFDGRLFLERRPTKAGLGSAYVLGLKWALARGYDYLIEMDADWSHHPRYLHPMLQRSDDADFVVGSRYIPGGGTLNWGWNRRMLSRFGSLYARWVLGVQMADFTGGFNGWHAEVLRAISLDTISSEGYSFQIELKYRASRLGFKHIEFPIVFEERKAGSSKMSMTIAFEAMWRTWVFRVKRNTGY